jgi:hypothetical protein
MSDEGQRADLARKNEGQSPDRPSVSAPEVTDLMNKNEEGRIQPAARSLVPGDGIPPSAPERRLASVSRTPAMAAPSTDVTESPEGGAEPDRPVEQPPSHMPTRARAGVSKNRAFPSFMRRYMAGASGEHLEPVEPEDDRKIPKFLRRHGVGAAHAQPIVSDRELSERPQADHPRGFVPSIVLRDRQVTPVVTMPNPLVAGSTCPLCGCRVPARASAADRQRASRARRRASVLA